MNPAILRTWARLLDRACGEFDRQTQTGLTQGVIEEMGMVAAQLEASE